MLINGGRGAKMRERVSVCMCERERELEQKREREREREQERERERERGGWGEFNEEEPDRDGRNGEKQLRRKTAIIDIEKDRKI